MKTVTFTPNGDADALDLPRFDEQRVQLSISESDRAQMVRGAPWRGVFTDRTSGRSFECRDADCGAGCRCAAEIIREVTPPKRT